MIFELLMKNKSHSELLEILYLALINNDESLLAAMRSSDDIEDQIHLVIIDHIISAIHDDFGSEVEDATA